MIWVIVNIIVVPAETVDEEIFKLTESTELIIQLTLPIFYMIN